MQRLRGITKELQAPTLLYSLEKKRFAHLYSPYLRYICILIPCSRVKHHKFMYSIESALSTAVGSVVSPIVTHVFSIYVRHCVCSDRDSPSSSLYLTIVHSLLGTSVPPPAASRMLFVARRKVSIGHSNALDYETQLKHVDVYSNCAVFSMVSFKLQWSIAQYIQWWY